MASKGIGGHHRAFRGKSDDWITPKYIIDALGPFDLDPCIAENMPWQTASVGYTKHLDGLNHNWDKNKRIWLNPPYGPETGSWLEKLAQHGNGVALIFSRTETKFFQEQVFQKANAIIFLAGRLTFCTTDGKKAPHNSGGPSCLVAYGADNALKLEVCGLSGHLVWLREPEQF